MSHRLQALLAWTVACGLCALAALPVQAGTPVILTHIHGLSYSADGARLLVPSHHGLAVYADGRWSIAEGPLHDYQGFSATRDALYSSGHPAPGSELADPFGLIKSSDDGRTWQPLGLAGESDFHILASCHATGAVYVANKVANTRMSEVGIYHTRTDGLRWQRAAAKGLGRWLHGLAVHPRDAAVVAAAADEGLYLSRNWADSFERLVGGMVIAASFAPDGEHLWFSTYSDKAGLARIALKTGAKVEELAVPGPTDDAVSYISFNPVRQGEIAIATFKRSVLLSKDQGRTWTPIARDGITLE